MAKKKNIVTLKNMLKSNSANGKPLSDKQKKYFADLMAKQLGTYQDGGLLQPLPIDNTKTPLTRFPAYQGEIIPIFQNAGPIPDNTLLPEAVTPIPSEFGTVEYPYSYANRPITPTNFADKWTTEMDTTANTEGTIPARTLQIRRQDKLPNLFRKTGTACEFNGKTIDECISGVQLGLDANYPEYGGDTRKGSLGIAGSSWEIGQNVVDKGGKYIYNLQEGKASKSDLKRTEFAKEYLKSAQAAINPDYNQIVSDAQNGDIVEMYYANSPSQSKAAKAGKANTHAGTITTGPDSEKYVTHNLYGTWYSDKLSDLLTTETGGKNNHNIIIAGIVRPSYEKVTGNDINTTGVHIKETPNLIRSGSGDRNPQQGTEEEAAQWQSSPANGAVAQQFVKGLSAYAPQVQQDFGWSDKEMEELMKISYALLGKESGFGESESYKKKTKHIRTARVYKAVAPDFLPQGDEASEGLTQIKLNTLFDKENDQKLLEKYGIDRNSVYDPEVSAAATMLAVSKYYDELRRVTDFTFDNIYPMTMRNILFLAHNKGMEAVIQNEFTDREKKPLSFLRKEENRYNTPPTKNFYTLVKGLETYSNLHMNKESYANVAQDYANSLEVNYEAVKAAVDYIEPKEDLQGPKLAKDYAAEKIDLVRNRVRDKQAEISEKLGRADDKIKRGVKKVSDKGKEKAREAEELLKRAAQETDERTRQRLIDAAREIKRSFEHGGAIVDPMGQWAHPGQNTIIPSNDITMKGVPYQVLGISDTNDMKIMQPGKNYKFKGKKVLEIPLMQSGGSIVGKQIAPASTGVSIPEYFVRQGMFKRPEDFLVLPQEQKLLLVDQYMRDERGAIPIADSGATQMYKPGKLNQDYVANVVGVKTKLRNGGPVEVLKALAPAALGLIPGVGSVLAPMASAAINAIDAIDAPKPVMPAAPKEEIRNTTNPFTGMSYKFGGSLGNRAKHLKSVNGNALKETTDPRFYLTAGDSHDDASGGEEGVVSGGARLKFESGELYSDKDKAFVSAKVLKDKNGKPLFQVNRDDNITKNSRDLLWKDLVAANNEMNMAKGQPDRMIMRNGGKLPLMQDGGAKSGKDTAISTDNTYDGTADPNINQFPWGAFVNVPGMLADLGMAAGGYDKEKDISYDPVTRPIEGVTPSYATFDAAQNKLFGQFKGFMNNIDTTQSGGAAAANKQNAWQKYLQSTSDLAVQKASQKYSDDITKATALSGAAAEEIKNAYMNRDLERQNKAAWQRLFGEGLVKGSEGISGYIDQKNADRYNALTLSLAQQIAANYKFDVEAVLRLLKSGATTEEIIKYLSED